MSSLFFALPFPATTHTTSSVSLVHVRSTTIIKRCMLRKLKIKKAREARERGGENIQVTPPTAAKVIVQTLSCRFESSFIHENLCSCIFVFSSTPLAAAEQHITEYFFYIPTLFGVFVRSSERTCKTFIDFECISLSAALLDSIHFEASLLLP